MTSSNGSLLDSYLTHWADQAAAKTLAAHSDKQAITVAAGITPSGVVHVGNFREVITVDLVARALRDRGAKVRFLYSWDDFDVLRKVPEGMPNRTMLHDHLGYSLVDVPDPFGECDSYASYHIRQFETSLQPMGIQPEFIRQSKRYRAGVYAQGIRRALEHKDTIREILNQAREQTSARTRLTEDWLPLYGFCNACKRDKLDFEYDGNWGVHVACKLCGHHENVDLQKGGNIKLPWRVDWPMRWAFEGVDFEPGGKDHSTHGGSYDTAKEIVVRVYQGHVPEYVAYDFVLIKGQPGKISSSSGNVITVADCLEVYEPALLRWIFASSRPNREFQISFDLDVVKIYEDYDRSKRLAYSADDGSKDDKKRQIARRTLQLASVDHRRIYGGEPMSFQPQFRHLSMILQIYEGDLQATCNYYVAAKLMTTEEENSLCLQRAQCVWNWLLRCAPEEFRYQIRKEPILRALSQDEAEVLTRLVSILRETPHLEEQDLVPHMSSLCQGTALDNQSFLPVVYDLLIGRPKGPKLTTLLGVMGSKRALYLLEPSLQQV